MCLSFGRTLEFLLVQRPFPLYESCKTCVWCLPLKEFWMCKFRNLQGISFLRAYAWDARDVNRAWYEEGKRTKLHACSSCGMAVPTYTVHSTTYCMYTYVPFTFPRFSGQRMHTFLSLPICTFATQWCLWATEASSALEFLAQGTNMCISARLQFSAVPASGLAYDKCKDLFKRAMKMLSNSISLPESFRLRWEKIAELPLTESVDSEWEILYCHFFGSPIKRGDNIYGIAERGKKVQK